MPISQVFTFIASKSLKSTLQIGKYNKLCKCAYDQLTLTRKYKITSEWIRNNAKFIIQSNFPLYISYVEMYEFHGQLGILFSYYTNIIKLVKISKQIIYINLWQCQSYKNLVSVSLVILLIWFEKQFSVGNNKLLKINFLKWWISFMAIQVALTIGIKRHRSLCKKTT